MRSWIWALVVGAVVVIAGAAFATGMIFGGGGDKPPRVDIVKPTPEEQELQKIRIAASAGELVEATHGVDGWIVRVKQDVRQLDPRQLQEATVRFFRELDRSGVPIAETSFELRTNVLKDVWGETLPDVSVFRVGLQRETFDRINWRGMIPENLERVSDEYWMHDIVKQMGQQGQSQGGSGGGGGGAEDQQGKGGSGQGG